MNKLHSIFDFISRFKIFFVILFFGVMTVFLDSNSLWHRRVIWDSIDKLKKEIAQYDSSYCNDTRELEELRANPRKVVRVAREKYFMTRPDEDLFVIQTDPSAPEGAVVRADDPEDEDPEV